MNNSSRFFCLFDLGINFQTAGRTAFSKPFSEQAHLAEAAHSDDEDTSLEQALLRRRAMSSPMSKRPKLAAEAPGPGLHYDSSSIKPDPFEEQMYFTQFSNNHQRGRVFEFIEHFSDAMDELPAPVRNAQEFLRHDRFGGAVNGPFLFSNHSGSRSSAINFHESSSLCA